MGYLREGEVFTDPRVIRRMLWRWACDRPMTCVWFGVRVLRLLKPR